MGGQLNANVANAKQAKGTWDKTLNVVNGKYTCWGTLTTQPKKGGAFTATISNKIKDVQVK